MLQVAVEIFSSRLYKRLTIGAKGDKMDTVLNILRRIFMKKTKKFLAGLLTGLSVLAGSLCLVACNGDNSSSSSNSGNSQPKGVVYEIIDDTAQVVDYDGTATSVTIEATYEGVAVTKIADEAFKNTSIVSVEIPNSVLSIGDSAFYLCDDLTSVTIPNSVTAIGASAFRGCTGLTSVTISGSVTSIGNRAFEDCSGLTTLEIPGGVASIGNSAFTNCTSLTSVTIASSVTSIGDGAFAYSTALASVNFGGTKSQWNAITGNTNWTFVTATKVVCSNGEVDLKK